MSQSPRFYDSAKFGNVVTFQAPLGTNPPWVSRGVCVATNQEERIPSDVKPLLEVDLSQASTGDASGSWVLTIDQETEFANVVGPGSSGEFVCPLVVTISLGTGGSQQTLQTDARNQSFQVPGANVRVSVGWDDFLPPWYSPSSGTQWIFPTKTTVRASIQRGFSSGTARRTQLLPKWSASRLDPYFARIPNFATCFRVWGERTDPFFGAVNGGKVAIFGDISQNGAFFGGKQITYKGQNLENPAGVPCPAHGQDFVITPGLNVSPFNSGLYSIEWDVRL